MTRRQFILCVALIAIIAAASTAAFRLWRQQERSAIARAALPMLPNPARWPAELMTQLEETSAAVQTAQEPLAPLARLASLYLANGFDAEATSAIGALRRIDPKNARWAYLEGELHLRRGDKRAFAAALETTLALDPTYAPGWIRLGDLELERGAIGRAEECFLQAATNEPGDVRARFRLIQFEARHGKRTDPRRSLGELVDDFPGIKELHELLSQLHAAAGNTTRAAEERRLAAKSRRYLSTSDPWLDELAAFCHDADRLERLALRLDREGEATAAERLLKRAMRLSPGESARRKALARFFEANDRSTEARKLLETAVAELPDDPELREGLSRALLLEHKPLEAAAVARAGLQRWSGRGAMHAALGRALRDARELDEAVPVLRAAIQLDPTWVEARYDLAFCLAGLKQRDEARTLAEQAMIIRPDYPEVLVLLGSLALENGELEAAEKLVLKLYAMRPDEPGSQLLFGALLRAKGDRAQESGDLTEAAQLYESGLEFAPEFAPLLHEAALLAARRARYGQVVELLERYLRLEPKDLQAHALLATGYREIEQLDALERVLENGLELAVKLGDKAMAAEFNRQLDEL